MVSGEFGSVGKEDSDSPEQRVIKGEERSSEEEEEEEESPRHCVKAGLVLHLQPASAL